MCLLDLAGGRSGDRRASVIKQSSECPGNLESGLCGQDSVS